MEHHDEIEEYFNRRGVSVIFLFRRNLLRRMVSLLANSYDRYAKLFNGTHKSHVHSLAEVALSLSLSTFGNGVCFRYGCGVMVLFLAGRSTVEIQAIY